MSVIEKPDRAGRGRRVRADGLGDRRGVRHRRARRARPRSRRGDRRGRPQGRLGRSLDRGLSSGKLSEEDRGAAVARLAFTTDLADMADRQLVVEAIVENEAMKTDVFAQSTSSSPTTGDPRQQHELDPDHEARHRHRPTEQVIGIHFFTVPVLRLVKLVTSLMTSPETISQANSFATDVLRRVIRSQDRAGFVVSALLIPYLLSAIRMMESGFATADDIDTGMVEGCNHPMGPLHLTDLIGLDTTLAVAQSLYEEFKEPLYAATPAVADGRGWSARTQDRSRVLRVRHALMAERVERLTNLLALLLETPAPLSLVEIAGELRGQYPEKEAARRGAFERDKAALREMGVPIEQEVVVGGPYAGSTKYWIVRPATARRPAHLEPDEIRALQVAVAAARTGSELGQEAMWKLGSGVIDREAAVVATMPSLPSLPLLRESIARRATVEFVYRDVDRTVEPYGLLLQNGFWYLVAFDRTRGERRTFRVDRIDGRITMGAGDEFERPEASTCVRCCPTTRSRSAPRATRRRRSCASARHGRLRSRELGADRVVETLPNGDVDVRVPCANREAFRSWVLGLLEHAESDHPPTWRADVVDWLERRRPADGACLVAPRIGCGDCW